jgi:hypothetical protein
MSWFTERPQLAELLYIKTLPSCYVVNLAPESQSDTVINT